MSLVIYTFYPLTLNQYLGTLTIVWVVPLLQHELIPRRFFLNSMMLEHSELDKEGRDFSPLLLNP